MTSAANTHSFMSAYCRHRRRYEDQPVSNKYRFYVAFERVPVGANFFWSGDECKKTSTRTADILSLRAARRFYFKMKETCAVDAAIAEIGRAHV